jgi:hypothetical protein
MNLSRRLGEKPQLGFGRLAAARDHHAAALDDGGDGKGFQRAHAGPRD